MTMNKPLSGVERVLRVPDVAAHLGVTPDTIYALIREGKMRAIRLGRVLRVPQSALVDFIAGIEPSDAPAEEEV